MFDLVKRCGLATCYRCEKEIETEEELSIEHKNGWQLAADPVAAFFNLDDIGFSHLLCNIKAGGGHNKIHASRAEAKRVQSRRPVALAKKTARNAARDRRAVVV